MTSPKNGKQSNQNGNSTLFNLDDSSSFDISAQDSNLSKSTTPPSASMINNSNSKSDQRTAYGLASTQSSREAQFDLDNDSIDSEDEQRLNLISSQSNHPLSPGNRSANGNGPTLMDRLANPIVGQRGRQSLDDIGRNLRSVASNAVPGWDGEGIPDWLKRGGSVFEGTVNMANSILGAGIVGECKLRGERLELLEIVIDRAGIRWRRMSFGLLSRTLILPYSLALLLPATLAFISIRMVT